jgi:RNA polymerase sigma-70 factor (ECF subfamily)
VDGQSFDEFYGATSKRTLQFAYAMCGDHGVAQDLTQEAYVRAWQRWSRLADYDHPESWLRMVVTRLVTDRWRWLGVRRRHTVYSRDPAEVAPPSEDRVVIDAALRTLPSRHRQAIVMHYLLDMPINAIAEETGVPVGTVKSWLSRGREGLALELSELTPTAQADDLRTAGDRRIKMRRAGAVSLGVVLVTAIVGIVLALVRAHVPPPPVGPTPTDIPPTVSTPSAAASMSTSPPSDAACQVADLDPRPYYAYEAAAGTAYGQVIVQNISAHACKLTGFPRIDGVDKTTGKVVTVKLNHHGTPGSAQLLPGQQAYLTFRMLNGPNCDTPSERSFDRLEIVFADGSRYPLPAFELTWYCFDATLSSWWNLELPLNQVAPEITRAP